MIEETNEETTTPAPTPDAVDTPEAPATDASAEVPAE